jgi:predicted porin
MLPYLALYLDYTRVNPFVYNNLNPAQSYTSFGYNLGDWVGNNFDRKIAGLKYTPFPRLRLDLRYENIRKGPEYSLEEQYLEVPTKKFLEKIIRKQRQLAFNINYELNNNIYFISNYNYTESHNNTINTILFNHNFNFGFKIGL